MFHQYLNSEEAAAVTRLPIAVLQLYASLGLIAPETGYAEDDICELRRVRRLMDDLGLEHEAIEIVLRMRQRILILEQELQQVRVELQAYTRQPQPDSWFDAEWRDML